MTKTAFVMPSTRPVLQWPKSSLEIGLETAAVLSLLTMAFIMIKSWPLLPETIPHHFGVSGKPVFLILIFGTIGVYFVKAYQAR